MRTTLAVIKADVGSIGGHICPSEQLLHRVKEFVALPNEGRRLVLDSYVSFSGAAMLPMSRTGIYRGHGKAVEPGDSVLGSEG